MACHQHRGAILPIIMFLSLHDTPDELLLACRVALIKANSWRVCQGTDGVPGTAVMGLSAKARCRACAGGHDALVVCGALLR